MSKQFVGAFDVLEMEYLIGGPRAAFEQHEDYPIVEQVIRQQLGEQFHSLVRSMIFPYFYLTMGEAGWAPHTPHRGRSKRFG